MHSKSLRSLDGAFSPLSSDLPEDLFDVFSDGPNESTHRQQNSEVKDGEQKVSIFKVRILAIMICRGTYQTKATYLFDLIKSTYPLDVEAKPTDKISWHNPRLKRSIRLIIEISEMIPKRYYLAHKDSMYLKF